MLVVVFTNQKGGVGKTTTTVNMARAAHLRGFRVLIVDIDPQGNTTVTVLGGPPAPGSLTLAHVLRDPDVPAVKAIRQTGWEGVDILPSGGDELAAVSTELVAALGREYRLRKALAPLDGTYDLVLIDSPPNLDQLPINALVAADKAVIVTRAELYATFGIARFLRTVEIVREHFNPALELPGIIVNAYEDRINRQQKWLQDLHANVPVPVWGFPPADGMRPVQRADFVARAIEAGLGLDEWGTPPATELAKVFNGYLTRLLGGGR